MDENDLDKKLENFKKLSELKAEMLINLVVQLQTEQEGLRSTVERLRIENRGFIDRLTGRVSQMPQRPLQRPPQQGQKGLEAGQKPQVLPNIGNKVLPPVEFPKTL